MLRSASGAAIIAFAIATIIVIIWVTRERQ
jgi:hypothetical protein